MKYIKHIKVVGIFSVVMSLLVGIFLTAQGSAAAGFYLSPGSQSVTVGSSFNVAIRVNASPAIDTVQVHITYPSDKLQLVGSVSYAGSPFESHASQSTTAGDISFVAYTTGSAPSGDVLIATVAFAPMATGSASVNFASDTAAAAAGVDVTGTKSGATYTIQSAPAPTPSPGGGGTSGGSTGGSSGGTSTSGGTSGTGSTAGNRSTGTGGSSNATANSTTTNQPSGAALTVDGGTVTQDGVVVSAAESTAQKKTFGISQQTWKTAAIIGGIVLVLLGIWAFFWIRTGKVLPFVGNTIKPNKYSYKADPDLGPTVVGGQTDADSPIITGGSMEDRLGKIQGTKTHAPGDTIHPTTPGGQA